MSGAQLGPVGESGGIGDGLQDLEHAERSGERVAAALGAGSLDDLRAVSVEALMAVPPQEDAGPRWSTDAGMEVGLGAFDSAYPIVDGHLVPGDPFTLYEAARFHSVPLLTGSTADERSGIPFLTSERDFLAYAHRDYGELADEFLERFPAGSDAAARESSACANGDRIFIWQNWALARLHARAGRAATFYYHTSRIPPLPPGHGLAEPNPGAFHSLEIPYLFRNLEVRPWPWEEQDRVLSDAISGAWLAFARSGDPNGAGLPRWEPFDPLEPAALHLGDEIGMGPVPRLAHLAFWDRYYERLRQSSPPGSL
jgi:para-nitrobenzyl esterase